MKNVDAVASTHVPLIVSYANMELAILRWLNLVLGKLVASRQVGPLVGTSLLNLGGRDRATVVIATALMIVPRVNENIDRNK